MFHTSGTASEANLGYQARQQQALSEGLDKVVARKPQSRGMGPAVKRKASARGDFPPMPGLSPLPDSSSSE